jgi:hypothetical protein
LLRQQHARRPLQPPLPVLRKSVTRSLQRLDSGWHVAVLQSDNACERLKPIQDSVTMHLDVSRPIVY